MQDVFYFKWTNCVGQILKECIQTFNWSEVLGFCENWNLIFHEKYFNGKKYRWFRFHQLLFRTSLEDLMEWNTFLNLADRKSKSQSYKYAEECMTHLKSMKGSPSSPPPPSARAKSCYLVPALAWMKHRHQRAGTVALGYLSGEVVWIWFIHKIILTFYFTLIADTLHPKS